jgi:hypothetical protein
MFKTRKFFSDQRGGTLVSQYIWKFLSSTLPGLYLHLKLCK